MRVSRSTGAALGVAVICALFVSAAVAEDITVTPVGGTTLAAKTDFEVKCLSGFITDFNGREGLLIDALGPFKCSNGQSLPQTGSGGGSAWSHSAPSGYSAVGVNAGDNLDKITLHPATGPTISYGGTGGTAKPIRACASGSFIAGVFGQYETSTRYLVTIGLICRTKQDLNKARGGSYDGPTTVYTRTCPAGTYITAFNGRAGDAIDAIGSFTCSGGSTLSIVGGSVGGTAWIHSSVVGYTGIATKAGVLIDQLTVYFPGGNFTRGGTGGTAQPKTMCGPGTRLAGVYGKTTPTNPITIGVVCRF